MISTVIKRTVYHRKNGKHICNICGCQINSFVPGGVISEASKKHFIVGAGYRDNYRCPCCNAIDRMRWQKYVVDNYLEYINFKGKILHFAPEKMLSDYYRNNSTALLSYRCAYVPLRFHMGALLSVYDKELNCPLLPPK